MPASTRARFLALTASSLAAAGYARPAAAAAISPPLTIRVSGTPLDDTTALYYAIKSGMFARAGLSVEMTLGANGAAVLAAVISGNFDIGKSSMISIFEGHEKGLPFTVIAPAGMQEPAVPNGSTIILKESLIASGKDLENQVVGVASLSSIGRIALCGWVEKTGGDWRAVHFVEIPLPQGPAAVEAKRVLAAECAQPLLSSTLATGKFRTLPTFETIAPEFLYTTWFTTSDWSKQHPDGAAAFARVLADAAKYVNAHHAETAAMMAEVTGIELGAVQKMVRVTIGSAVIASQMQPCIDAAARYGAIAKPFPAPEIIDRYAVRKA
jgi:NitT/TauT family transport system substrate-binding protein